MTPKERRLLASLRFTESVIDQMTQVARETLCGSGELLLDDDFMEIGEKVTRGGK